MNLRMRQFNVIVTWEVQIWDFWKMIYKILSFKWHCTYLKTRSLFRSGQLRFHSEIENFLSLCWCILLRNPQTAAASVNEPLGNEPKQYFQKVKQTIFKANKNSQNWSRTKCFELGAWFSIFSRPLVCGKSQPQQ